MCGANAAQLLELGETRLKYTLMFRKMPKSFLEIFTRGCSDAISSGSPARLAGAGGREDGGRELYRTVFIPVSVNLVFRPSIASWRTRRPDLLGKQGGRFAGNLLPVIREIEIAGACSLGEIAAALNARGLRTLRGRSWSRATARNLFLRTSK